MAALLVRTFGIPVALSPTTNREVVNTYTSGLLTRMGNYATSITYHPNRMINQVVHGNGLIDTQQSDPNHLRRPASIATTHGATTMWSTGTYTYDGAGNIAKMGTSGFTYDKVSRLITSTLFLSPTGGGTQVAQTYTFDPYGNLTAIGGSSGRTIPTNPANNRLSSATVAYDTAGNLTAWNGAIYEYDAFNQMQRMKSGSEDWLYFCNADDERIWSYNVPENRSRWTLRDLGNQVLREYTSNNGSWGISSDYIYRDGLLLAAETPAGPKHFHLDHLGTPRLITNGAGQQTAYHVYYPFGEEATTFNQDVERMKFTGHERDLGSLAGAGDDLDYIHARVCSPVTGRFVSVDPSDSARRSQPQTWNKYTYGLNNPVRYIDKDGQVEREGQLAGVIVNRSSATIWIAGDVGTKTYVNTIGSGGKFR